MPDGINEEYQPNTLDEKILEVLHEGRANPYLMRKRTGASKQQLNQRLNRLVSAGWVDRIAHGLYELVADPRE